MKVLFLHLSDLHIKTDNAYCKFQIEKMIDSLRAVGSFDKMVIIFSGDIAFSGEYRQYSVAIRIIQTIKRELQNRKIYSDKVHVICVPGNHDIEFENPPRSSEELNKIFAAHSYDSYIDTELAKQTNFMNFVRYHQCFVDNGVFSQKAIDFGGFKIEVNMINTGVFSLRRDEDKGLHYIPQSAINKLNTPTSADFVISVMHHSYDWYIDSQKEQLEKALLCKSSLIFLGHEHRIGTKQYSYDARAAAVIHAGGSLCNNDDWTQSEYTVSLLDTDNYAYTIYPHSWDLKEQQYTYSSPITQTLPQKPSVEKRLIVCDDYRSKMLIDPLRNLSPKFTDYFVFPRIESEEYGDTLSKEFLTLDSFFREISEQKRVLISGANGCGKTALLKKIFLELSESKCVIYCDIDTIKNKDSGKIVKSNFQDIYGDDYASHVRFKQLAPENKVLIIDDIDQIRARDFDQYISGIADEFGLMIFATKKVIDLDILERMKSALQTETSIAKYNITPFFSDKRQELVRKVVEIKHQKDTSIEIDETTDKLCEAIKLQKKFISLTPDFIIDFVDYYCTNIGTISNSDSTVFSKVFEANITSMIAPYQRGVLTTDKIHRLLSMTAYTIHFEKKYPIREEDILDIVKKYNEDNDDDVRPSTFFSIIKECKMLIEKEDGYKFANQNHLAYFVAREVNFLYNQTGSEEKLSYLLQNACFGINADILMFISYITDNTRVLRFLLATTQSFVDGWCELDFKNKLPSFLELHKSPELPPPTENNAEEAKQQEIANEKAVESKLATVDIYDYSEEDIVKPLNQIVRALSLLFIISKCLPGFEHNMDAQMRKAFVEEIYKLPNQIYHAWAQETEKYYDQIIQELKQDGVVEYSEHNATGEISELQVDLQLVSMYLLLDIYNAAAAHATKDNTFRLLDRFDRSSKDTYKIQHLMMLRKHNNAEAFVATAISMYEETDSELVKLLVKIVVRSAMIHMKKLDHKKRDQLSSVFFKTRQEQQLLLIKRTKEVGHKD